MIENPALSLDAISVHVNTYGVLITPKAVQDLLDELEASKQSRLRAWNVLQRLRLVLSEAGHVAIPPPPQKTFDEEGEILETALTKSLRIRSDLKIRTESQKERFGERLLGVYNEFALMCAEFQISRQNQSSILRDRKVKSVFTRIDGTTGFAIFPNSIVSFIDEVDSRKLMLRQF